MNRATSFRVLAGAALVATGAAAWAGVGRAQQPVGRAIDGNPAAVVDLRSQEGVTLAGARWRYRDARIVEVDGRSAGADLRASGPVVRSHTYPPGAGTPEFDDEKAWEAVKPEALESRRGNGKLSFGWYRTSITIPARIAPAQRIFIAHGRHDQVLPFQVAEKDIAGLLIANGLKPQFRPFDGDHRIDNEALADGMAYALGGVAPRSGL